MVNHYEYNYEVNITIRLDVISDQSLNSTFFFFPCYQTYTTITSRDGYVNLMTSAEAPPLHAYLQS